MATKDDLMAIEKQFWTGDADFYRQNLDKSCLLAFTEMSGAYGREDVAKTIKKGNRWRDLDLSIKGIVEPTDSTAILTYEAKAIRESGEPYKALVSTGYVKRDDGWKMTFHAQTPLDAQKAA
jgi:hypothetical protein